MEKNGKLIIISGPSGVGKGSLVKHLLKDIDNLELSISATTRLPRHGEKEGKHYYFLTKERFINMIENDEFLEYVKYNTNFYGTPKKKVFEMLDQGKNIILEIDVKGGFKIKEKYRDAVMIFIKPPCMEELYKRLHKRNTESQTEIVKRVRQAHEEMKLSKRYDYVIINDSFFVAKEKIKKIINS